MLGVTKSVPPILRDRWEKAALSVEIFSYVHRVDLRSLYIDWVLRSLTIHECVWAFLFVRLLCRLSQNCPEAVNTGCWSPPRVPHLAAWGMTHSVHSNQNSGMTTILVQTFFKAQWHGAVREPSQDVVLTLRNWSCASGHVVGRGWVAVPQVSVPWAASKQIPRV